MPKYLVGPTWRSIWVDDEIGIPLQATDPGFDTHLNGLDCGLTVDSFGVTFSLGVCTWKKEKKKEATIVIWVVMISSGYCLQMEGLSLFYKSFFCLTGVCIWVNNANYVGQYNYCSPKKAKKRKRKSELLEHHLIGLSVKENYCLIWGIKA